jgi:predicted ester cyclase
MRGPAGAGPEPTLTIGMRGHRRVADGTARSGSGATGAISCGRRRASYLASAIARGLYRDVDQGGGDLELLGDDPGLAILPRRTRHSWSPCSARAPPTREPRPPTVVAVPSPAGVYATALWLRAAFASLHHDIHHAVADGIVVAVNSTMNGRHVGPWAVYTDNGAVDTVFPPTAVTFAVTQFHWFRIQDGQIIEHWANRDDLGMPGNSAGSRPTPGLPVQDGARQAARQVLVTFATAGTSRWPTSASAQNCLGSRIRPPICGDADPRQRTQSGQTFLDAAQGSAEQHDGSFGGDGGC